MCNRLPCRTTHDHDMETKIMTFAVNITLLIYGTIEYMQQYIEPSRLYKPTKHHISINIKRYHKEE